MGVLPELLQEMLFVGLLVTPFGGLFAGFLLGLIPLLGSLISRKLENAAFSLCCCGALYCGWKAYRAFHDPVCGPLDDTCEPSLSVGWLFSNIGLSMTFSLWLTRWEPKPDVPPANSVEASVRTILRGRE